jgi:GNAT superfamily N-acetyltransferase
MDLCLFALKIILIIVSSSSDYTCIVALHNPIPLFAMYLRYARPEDEPLMVSMCTRAFFNDDLFGRVIHPFRQNYPDDVKVYWHETLRREWTRPRTHVLVAVEGPKFIQGIETIVGLAIWERQGDSNDAHTNMEDSSYSGPWPALETTQNRALDATKRTILQDSEAFSKQYWSGTRATNWYLNLCCVDPDFQQRGCGRLLVSWGLNRASQEAVHASVIASDGSTDFYLKSGFDEVVGNASRVGGEANPMMRANVQGGDVLFKLLEGDTESRSSSNLTQSTRYENRKP